MKRTPLYEAHKKLGAKLIPFAGFEMPLQYRGIIEEHLAVREKVGMFDVSHMGEIFVEGKDAPKFVDYITTNDAAGMPAGRAHYAALTTEKGTFVDDLLVYRLDEQKYLLVVNAVNTEKDYKWILEKSRGFEVEVTDKSSDIAQIAVQGPRAREVVQEITEADLSTVKYYRFVRTKVLGEEAIVSRTGYTGEDGFEIYVDAPVGEKIWWALLEAGKPYELQPAGLGARDTLRLEAGMLLYGNDMDETTTVLEADLEWIIKWDKDFIGREALLKQKQEGIKKKLVGFEMVDRGVARHGYRVFVDGKEFGTVCSGSYAPYLRKNIGNVYLPVEKTEIGTEFEVEIKGRRARAKVVERPFYSRKRKKKK